MPRAALAAGLALVTVASCQRGCGREPDAGPGAAPAGPAGVVVIVVDTLRADHLSQYGYGLPTGSPLDAFASQATRFTECYAPAGWTVPSTASLMTGLSPARHRALDMGDTLHARATTLAEHLAGGGYRTLGMSHNVYVQNDTGFGQGFETFLDFKGEILGYPDVSTMHAPMRQWLEQDRQRPFFVYAQPMNCHGPYKVPEEAMDDLLGRPPAQGFAYYDRLMVDILWEGKLERRADVTDEVLTSLVEKYDTAVLWSMTNVARMLDTLDELGLYEDTLVIVTSDHGEELFDHGGFSHSYSLHGELVHVPLLVKMPGQRDARTVDARVTLMDLVPTVLDAMGLPVPVGVDGRSLAAIASGKKVDLDPVPVLFASSWAKRCAAEAILDGRYKLVHTLSNYEGKKDVVALYDVETDPAESADVSASNAEVVQKLTSEMNASFDALAKDALPDPENVLDLLDEEALRSLGYLR